MALFENLALFIEIILGDSLDSKFLKHSYLDCIFDSVFKKSPVKGSSSSKVIQRQLSFSASYWFYSAASIRGHQYASGSYSCDCSNPWCVGV